MATEYQRQVNAETGNLGPKAAAEWKNTGTTEGAIYSLGATPLFYSPTQQKYVTAFESNAAPASVSFNFGKNKMLKDSNNMVLEEFTNLLGFGKKRRRRRSRKSKRARSRPRCRRRSRKSKRSRPRRRRRSRKSKLSRPRRRCHSRVKGHGRKSVRRRGRHRVRSHNRKRKCRSRFGGWDKLESWGMKKRDRSGTRPGDMDWTTKGGDEDFHRGNHDESEGENPYFGSWFGGVFDDIVWGGNKGDASKTHAGLDYEDDFGESSFY